MGLTEDQRGLLADIDSAKQTLEKGVHALNELLRHIGAWDRGNSGPLVPEDMTDTEVTAILRRKYTALRDAILAAAHALPEV